MENRQLLWPNLVLVEWLCRHLHWHNIAASILKRLTTDCYRMLPHLDSILLRMNNEEWLR